MLGVFVGTHADCSILSIPFGPSVVFTRSPTAIAPTNADNPIHRINHQFHILKLSLPSKCLTRIWFTHTSIFSPLLRNVLSEYLRRITLQITLQLVNQM